MGVCLEAETDGYLPQLLPTFVLAQILSLKPTNSDRLVSIPFNASRH